jgi:hypothetical protein
MEFELNSEKLLRVEFKWKFTGKSWNFGVGWNLTHKLLVTPSFKEK